MARNVIPVHEMDKYNEAHAFEMTQGGAIDAAEGAEIDFSGRDDKMLIMLQNTTGQDVTVTVKAGNGIQGVCDLTVELAEGGMATLALESGRFKNVSGSDKGKVILAASAAGVGVMVFKLP